MIRVLILALLALPAVAGAEGYSRRADVQSFIADMAQRHGFDPDSLAALFERASPAPAVIRAIMPPADPGVRSWQAYRNRFIEPQRVTGGREFMRRHRTLLNRAADEYGVPAEVVAAIIGVETLYGRHPGHFKVFNALANLAFDYPPRAELFRDELEALLLLAREQGRDPWQYRGSYAGAIGLPQFLPSSVRKFAVDFDGDGRIDLAGSVADAIGSVASFLNAHGWRGGQPIADPVTVDGDAAPLLAEGIRPVRLPAEMRPWGVKADDRPGLPAALIDLATPEAATEYRLGYQNFYVLTRYNRSSFYAATVQDLAAILRAAR